MRTLLAKGQEERLSADDKALQQSQHQWMGKPTIYKDLPWLLGRLAAHWLPADSQSSSSQDIFLFLSAKKARNGACEPCGAEVVVDAAKKKGTFKVAAGTEFFSVSPLVEGASSHARAAAPSPLQHALEGMGPELSIPSSTAATATF
jgi:hypothetical protein